MPTAHRAKRFPPIFELPVRRPGWTIAIWLVAVVALTGASRSWGGGYENVIDLPGSETSAGADLLARHFDSPEGYAARLVLHDQDGLADDAAAFEELTARLESTDGVLAAGDPLEPPNLSPDGTTAVLPLRLDDAPRNLDDDRRQSLRDSTAGLPSTVEASWPGALGDVLSGNREHRLPEAVGLGAALLVLLLVFGSVAGAVLPVLASVLGVLSGLGLLALLAAPVTFGTSAPVLATMIGLGCGIDYALFLVTRARQHVLGGAEPGEAVRRAVHSGGHAVLVAAGSVAVALLGLYASGIDFVARLGLAAVVTLGTAALASVTLAPAVLSLLGRRVDRLRVRPAARAEAEEGGAGWHRHARFVSRHAVLVVVGCSVLLTVLALPVTTLRLGHVDESADPVGSTTRIASDRLAAGFGPGAEVEVVAVLDLTAPPDPATLDVAEAVLAARPGVAHVTPFEVSADGEVAKASVVPLAAPQDSATVDLVHDLAGPAAEEVERVTGDNLMITGQTAAHVALADEMAARLPLIITVVVGAAFLLLMVSFRSVVVAAKAAVMNLMSIGASYGVLVAVFQWQWGSSLLGLDTSVPVESFVPMMMFAIVFGLSMDYEVFLLSRIREEWVAGKDNVESVAAGLAATARVISAAALIMVCVFLAFTQQDDVAVKMLAVGLAASVAIDATVVRLLLVPAAMVLLGRANWWLPGWLERLLPPGRSTNGVR
ncbi:MMPL family transporter [Nocardioides pelophilus]|uniref:MMPL family transporter n=1 Tax=Nocardioides pelophilus TaxID=2172019 RepID=UPI0015FF1D6A|nr:MMPL family transporter [Nocardioides pelophilus]